MSILRPLYSKIQLPDEPPDTIRLLKIESVANNQITCTLKQARLSEAPAYSTLSYTWRSPLVKDNGIDADPRKHSVQFSDGDSIDVFENLYQALLRIGKSNSLRHQHYWVDAVCIDQDNTTERNHQVDLMAQIYQHASDVVIWLGPDDEHVQSASKLIEILPKALQEIDEKDWSNRINPWRIEETDVAILREAGMNRIEPWVSLAHFFRRNWWSRSWVIQEVLFAKGLKVLVGDEHELSWSDLEIVSHFLSTTSWRRVLSQRDFLGIAQEASLPEHTTPTFLRAAKRDLGIDNDFLYTLIRARRHSCLLPVDKVFSLYGIASAHAQNSTIVPRANYNLTPDIAFTQTAKYILESSKDMHILSHIEGSKFQQIPNLPSWVPDWTVTEPIGLGITGYKRYWAAGDPEKCYQEPQFPEPSVLRLKAARIDDIEACATSQSNLGAERVFPEWLDLLQGLGEKYFTGESRNEVFWRTLICDTDNHKACPAPDELGTCFGAWLEKHGLVNAYSEKIKTEHLERTGSHDADRFDLCLSHRRAQKLFRTTEGFLGSGTESLQVGDSIWIVPGSRVPLIMRRRSDRDKERYELVGGAYLHGFMRPEPSVLPTGITCMASQERTLEYRSIEID